MKFIFCSIYSTWYFSIIMIQELQAAILNDSIYVRYNIWAQISNESYPI